MSNNEGPPFTPGRVPTRITDRQWARVATRVVGADLSQLGKARGEVHLRRVWVGIVKENCNASLKEVARFGRVSVAHSTVHVLFEKWKQFPWRERHGWLMMAEVAAGSDADWSPSAWHQELHELAAMSLGDKVTATPWHDPVARLRRPIIAGGGYGPLS